MSIPKFELDKSTPIDTEKATSFFGSEDTYFRLLEQYEDISLLSDLEKCAEAINQLDYNQVKERIHSIKGASAYAGASRITDHWYWMQYYFLEGENQKMMDLYPNLMESVVEFRVHYRKLLAERKGEKYDINPEHEKCPIANGYRIIKIKDFEYKWEMDPIVEQSEEVEQLDKHDDIVTEPQIDKQFESTQKPDKKIEEQEHMDPGVYIERRPVASEEESKPVKSDDLKQESMHNVAFDDSPNKFARQENEKKVVITEQISSNPATGNRLVEESLPNMKSTKEHNRASYPALMIEGDKESKDTGMWGCSKCIIF